MNGLKIDDHGLLHPEQLKDVYSGLRDYFMTHAINTKFLNVVSLTTSKNIILAAIAGAAQFWQTKMLAAPKEPKIEGARDESMAAATNRTMMYFLPIFTAFIPYRFPAGLALYWTASSVFAIAQQYIFLWRHPLPKPEIINGN